MRKANKSRQTAHVHWSDVPPSKRNKSQLMEWARYLETEVLVSVNTRLPMALRDEVKKVAALRGVTLQNVYAEALQLWLAKEPTDEDDA